MRFSCDKTIDRIRKAMENLRVENGSEKLTAEFVTPQADASFVFNGHESENKQLIREAVFFENTQYPVLIQGEEGVSGMSLMFSNVSKDAQLSSDGNLLFGAVGFGNQVGKTDICLNYTKKGQKKSLRFTTEVLSYKMDYRTDMSWIIRDIEQEYSMLSFAFMRETYINFRTRSGESTDLIWWQIFQSCFNDITKACRQIINSPRRKLHDKVSYERQERLRWVERELENEYYEFKDNPHHLYRTHELCHTNDTVENRFLKFVMGQTLQRFNIVSQHIRNAVAKSKIIDCRLDEMGEELKRLVNHPFFRNIGTFKGFSQDSLVMKKSINYRTIYQKWIELMCGYELEEGVNKLETKDISMLYEIWCFLKVKNIVSDLLGETAVAQYKGKSLTPQFIRDLNWGTHSEVTFLRTEDNVELATVMYNAPVREDDSRAVSAIGGTTTFTTQQRPDIVLRLTKRQRDIQYTFLFDAKYRISDAHPDDLDIPPSDAIDQMHRYRDAIYYIDPANHKPKREVIGGYVLFPGNYTREEFEKSHYFKSIKAIGIGAFPLRPSDGITIDPNSSEQALREQIAEWLKRSRMKTYLYRNVAPQHGLAYQDPDDVVLVNYANKEKMEKMKEKGLCYVRTDEAAGSIVLEPNSVNAKYVLLHNGTDGTLFKLKGAGPRFFSRKTLEDKGFSSLNSEYYLVYQFDTSKSKEYKQLKALARGGATLKPWFATWSQLMEGN
ncbi:MAG: DUF2357 domain-containing protein [Bacteroidales bacterium]|nr:DUF2357 domain-containing protein [Bacteroidales bacterium]